jgi:hypothetical protein
MPHFFNGLSIVGVFQADHWAQNAAILGGTDFIWTPNQRGSSNWLPSRKSRAQQPTMPVIGFLNRASPDQDQGRARAFRQGLAEAGIVEGRDVAIEYRWADGQRDPLQTSAAELSRGRVSVIAAGSRGSAISGALLTTVL